MISLVLAAVTVTGAWSRPAIDTAVVYATLHDNGPRSAALIGVSTPIARSAELHESTPTAGGSMQGMAMPAMAMHPVTRLVVPPHGTAVLRPGGYHVMLLGLRRPLAAGTRFPLAFHFADGAVVRVSVPVENRAF
jgi:copper(I)-binding protein